MKKFAIALAMAATAAMLGGTAAYAGEEVNTTTTAGPVDKENMPVIVFRTTKHDFGTFPEEKGKVTCTFVFQNVGKSDLVLQKVRASCGCTTPNWTKTPIAPGDTGFVTATYNASGRPGAFSKTITVTSNAEGQQRLQIAGEVIPKVKKPEEEYPFNIGDFRMKNQNVYMRTVDYPNTKTEKIQVINNGSEPMDISFVGVPKYLTVKAAPARLAAKEKGVIELTFNSADANDWGDMHSTFDVAINGKIEANKQINVNATVKESFANMTPEQKQVAPVLNVDNTFDLGSIEVGKKKKTFKFYVTNSGKNDLILHKVKSSNDNVKIEYPSKPIGAGKKGELKITVDPTNSKAGKFNYRATIICNDPNHSTTGVTLTGEYK